PTAPAPPPPTSAPPAADGDVAPCDDYSVYVAVDGSDTAECGPPTAACASIAAGLSKLQSAGTLCIAAGEYPEPILDRVPNGSEDRNTTVRAINRNAAVIKPYGSWAGYVIRVSGNSYIVFDGLVSDAADCTDCGTFGFFPEESHHIVVQNGTLRNGNGTYG